MAFELVIHAPVADIVLGSYETRSVIEAEGEARPAAVIDFAAYQAKRRARHQKG